MASDEPQWICIDCTDECEDQNHAWVRARQVERDGEDAWVVDLTDLNENPDV